MNSTHARRRPAPALALVFAASASALFADVTPATLFQDHAVLQRDKPVPVWGTADAGEKVAVTFAGQTKSTVAGQDGRWSVTLDPLPANAVPATLTIAGNNTRTLSDILVGEVWLASGQSNMEWAVKDTYDRAIDVPASANPLIRHIKIPRKVSDTPLAQAGGSWQLASPATTSEFTAVGYYFARDIHALVGVPVGIVNSTWGGTRAESWTDPDTLATNPALAYVNEAWAQTLADYPAQKAKRDVEREAWDQRRAAAQAAGQPFTERAPAAPTGPGHHATPSGLYNAMIHPLVPYAFRGAIWYQGESNADRVEQAVRYHELFSAMITGWRAKFGQGDFPFYWVQLANFSGRDPQGDAWAFLRESQTRTLALPATGQAVILDLGDMRDIHPRNKKDVGRRLARLALARDYGLEMVDSGPVFQKAEREGAGFRVTFAHAHGGLTAPLNTLSGFEIAGADKVFHPAEAKITRDTVLVSSAAVPEPVAVRYAWRNAPVAGLFNREGLPAAPFRTDTW
jgi:sialate O-acetylesterase